MKPKECIFCGGKPLTKEHIWPRWLRPYIVRDQKHYYSSRQIVHEARSESARKKWGGDPRDRTVRIVCRACNGGWMSQLQIRAKPLIMQLINGATKQLSTQDQRILAFWCAMCTMTAEFLEPERTAISAIHRAFLKNDTLLFSNWRIWIGDFNRVEWVGQWVHNMMPLASTDRQPAVIDGLPEPNTQTTTLVFGRLYVHVFSSEYEDVVSKIHLGERSARNLRQIWPIVDTSIAWPPKSMTDRDADDMAGAICNMLDEIGQAADEARAPLPSFPSIL